MVASSSSEAMDLLEDLQVNPECLQGERSAIVGHVLLRNCSVVSADGLVGFLGLESFMSA